MELNRIYNEDNLKTLSRMEDKSIDLILASPPYNQKKEYEKAQSVSDYLHTLNEGIHHYHRVLKDTGSICFQVGNMVTDGRVYPLDCLLFSDFINRHFIPRNRIVWAFGHGLHCKNRFSGRHETIMWFSKGDKYTFNLDPVRIPQLYPGKKHFKGDKKGQLSGNPLGKNPGDVWDITNVKHNHPEKTAHPCQFPLELANRLILSLTDPGQIVYDPYMGSGTTAESALLNKRQFIGSEIRADYVKIAEDRINKGLELYYPTSAA